MALTKVPSNLDATVATTQSASDNSTNVATTAYVTTAIANLSDSAPAALNTLNEIAAALGDDANYASTTTAAIAAKLPLAGGTLTGDLGINQAASGYGNLTVGGTGVIVALRASSGAAKLGFYEAGAGRFYLETINGSDGLKFVDGDGTTEHMRIAGDGKVSITSSGAMAMDVQGEGGAHGLAIGGNDAGFGYIGHRSSGSYDLAINSSGNVGIGTSGPTKSLSVKAPSGSNGGIDVFHNNGNKVAELVHHGSGDEGRLSLYDGGTSTVQLHGETGQPSYINSGNFGIGTTSPGAKLEVSGKDDAGAGDLLRLIFDNSPADTGVTFTDINSTVKCRLTMDSANTNDLRISSGTQMHFYGGTSNGTGNGHLTVNSSGHVGIVAGKRFYLDTMGDTYITEYAGNEIGFYTGGAQRVKMSGGHLYSNGNVYSGTSSASAAYTLNSQTTHGNWGVGCHNASYAHFTTDRGIYYFNTQCQASGGFHTYSDERLKEEISPLTGALDDVAKMNGVTFKWKDAEKRGGNSTGKQFGVIAQNMLEVDSELPQLNNDPLSPEETIETDDSYYSMDYSRLTPYFIEAIKELKTKLEAAEARIATLES